MASEATTIPSFTAFSEAAAKQGQATIEGTETQWQQNIAGVPLNVMQERVSAINARSDSLRGKAYLKDSALPHIQVGSALNTSSQIDSIDPEFPVVLLANSGLTSEVGIFVEPGSTKTQQQLIRGELLFGPDLFPYNEANKIPRIAANAISELIEGQEEKTNDSRAYTLDGIEIRHELGRSPSVVYHLVAPGGQDGLPAKRAMVERSTHTDGADIHLFDSEEADTFQKYAEQQNGSRSMISAHSDNAQAAVAKDSLDLYLQIKAHGVNISPEVRLLSRAEGEYAVSDKLTQFLGGLPLTGKLTADFMDQVRQEAVEKVRVEREMARLRSEQQAREAAEREAREAGDRKLRAGYLGSVMNLQMYNIFSGNGTPVRSAEDMMAEMIGRDGSRKDPKQETDRWRVYLARLVDGQRITEHGITFNVERPRDPFSGLGFGTRGVVGYNPSTGEVGYTPENREHGKFVEVSAGLVNDEGAVDAIQQGTDERKTFDPHAVIKVTEVMDETGRTETYNLLFNATDKDGFVVQCPSGNAYYWKFNMFNSGFMYPPGMRKPVIYLYPKKRTKTEVRIKLTDAQFTNTYPQINGDTWEVIASPNGTLTVNGKKYKYLFWDGNPTREVEWDWSEGFSVHRDNVDTFLEQKVKQLGLNFAEAQDFITYWAPLMKQNEWSLAAFQTERYEELAQLLVDPKPDTLIRVYMVFKKIDSKLNLPEQKLKKMKRKGFTVVEWGGSNADELEMQIPKFDAKVRKPFSYSHSFVAN